MVPSPVFLPTYSWSRLFYTWPNHLSLCRGCGGMCTFFSQNKAKNAGRSRKNAGRSRKNAGNTSKCGISRTIAGWLTPMKFFFFQVVPSPESFFRRILGLVSLRGQTTSFPAPLCYVLYFQSLPDVIVFHMVA